MCLALGITNRKFRFVFGHPGANKFLPIFQSHRQISKFGRYSATRFEDRFNYMNPGKAPAHTSEVGPNFSTQVSQPVTLRTPGLLGVEKNFPAMGRISMCSQREL